MTLEEAYSRPQRRMQARESAKSISMRSRRLELPTRPEHAESVGRRVRELRDVPAVVRHPGVDRAGSTCHYATCSVAKHGARSDRWLARLAHVRHISAVERAGTSAGAGGRRERLGRAPTTAAARSTRTDRAPRVHLRAVQSLEFQASTQRTAHRSHRTRLQGVARGACMALTSGLCARHLAIAAGLLFVKHLLLTCCSPPAASSTHAPVSTAGSTATRDSRRSRSRSRLSPRSPSSSTSCI